MKNLFTCLSIALVCMTTTATAQPSDDLPFMRGDADTDNDVDLSDALKINDWVNWGGPEPVCLDAADANDSGTVTGADVTYLIAFLYSPGSPPPPSPYPDCDDDPTGDDLGCEDYDCPGS